MSGIAPFRVMVAYRGRTAMACKYALKASAIEAVRRLQAAYEKTEVTVWATKSAAHANINWEVLREKIGGCDIVLPPAFTLPAEIAGNEAAKRLENPKDKLHSRLIRAIRGTLSGKRVEPYVFGMPYTVNDLMDHIASQFESGMAWKNWGEWHIDHIKPCVSFNLGDQEQVIACFALSNLPLWADANLAKSVIDRPREPPIEGFPRWATA